MLNTCMRIYYVHKCTRTNAHPCIHTCTCTSRYHCTTYSTSSHALGSTWAWGTWRSLDGEEEHHSAPCSLCHSEPDIHLYIHVRIYQYTSTDLYTCTCICTCTLYVAHCIIICLQLLPSAPSAQLGLELP